MPLSSTFLIDSLAMTLKDLDIRHGFATVNTVMEHFEHQELEDEFTVHLTEEEAWFFNNIFNRSAFISAEAVRFSLVHPAWYICLPETSIWRPEERRV